MHLSIYLFIYFVIIFTFYCWKISINSKVARYKINNKNQLNFYLLIINCQRHQESKLTTTFKKDKISVTILLKQGKEMNTESC